ncbi:MAG: hypothetical protein ABI831_26970 [Betaproteobacteria bacterium]
MGPPAAEIAEINVDIVIEALTTVSPYPLLSPISIAAMISGDFIRLTISAPIALNFAASFIGFRLPITYEATVTCDAPPVSAVDPGAGTPLVSTTSGDVWSLGVGEIGRRWILGEVADQSGNGHRISDVDGRRVGAGEYKQALRRHIVRVRDRVLEVEAVAHLLGHDAGHVGDTLTGKRRNMARPLDIVNPGHCNGSLRVLRKCKGHKDQT